MFTTNYPTGFLLARELWPLTIRTEILEEFNKNSDAHLNCLLKRDLINSKHRFSSSTATSMVMMLYLLYHL